MGTGELNSGGNPLDGLASHIRGRRNMPSRSMLHKAKISAGLMDQLAHMQALSYPTV